MAMPAAGAARAWADELCIVCGGSMHMRRRMSLTEVHHPPPMCGCRCCIQVHRFAYGSDVATRIQAAVESRVHPVTS